MLVLLSPAKSMCSFRASSYLASCPVLLEKTDTLLKVMKGKSKAEIKNLMHISDAVASLNYERYQKFITNEEGDVTSAAIASNSEKLTDTSSFKLTSLIFDGPAYRSFDANSFTAQQYHYAQKHVRILSGLYGILKPWDVIQEYRLEMGTKMNVGSVTSLYEFWGDLITDNLLADLNTQSVDGKEYDQMVGGGEINGIQNGDASIALKTTKKGKKNKMASENIDASKEVSSSAPTALNQGRIKVIVNLASQEYFKSVRTKRLCTDPLVRVVECVFKDKGRVTSVYAKRARGLMARYIVTQAIPSPSQSIPSGISNEDAFQQCLTQLKGFDLEGYSYQSTQSNDQCLVFNRTSGPPIPIGDEEEGEGEEGVKKSKVKVASAKKQKKESNDETTAVAEVKVEEEKQLAVPRKRKISAVSKVPSTANDSAEDVIVKEETKPKGRVAKSKQTLVSIEDVAERNVAEDTPSLSVTAISPARRIRITRNLQ